MGSNTSKYNKEEISLHNSEDDCWIIYNRKVYNVTEFLNKHPAGKETILRKAGTDVTEDINFHSSYVKKILKKYFIGYLTS